MASLSPLKLFLALFLASISRPFAVSALIQTISTTPVVICPGFGNDEIDYETPLQQPREVGLRSVLERRGFDPNLLFTVPVQRSDWIRVAGGLLDFKFYTNDALPTGRGYGWYVQRFRETVDRAYDAAQNLNDNDTESRRCRRVLVIAHSAGGWLSRAGMGDGLWDKETQTADKICGLVTVGAIHKPPVSVASCVTRGALANTDRLYPGAFLKDQGIGYVSVGGNAIQGDKTDASATQNDEESSNADSLYATRGEGSASKVAFTSYESVCGSGNVMGDGVVPLEWTQLAGSRQLQLDGVLHSINEAGTTIPTDRWYGSENVIDRWLDVVLDEAGITKTKQVEKVGLGQLQNWVGSYFAR